MLWRIVISCFFAAVLFAVSATAQKLGKNQNQSPKLSLDRYVHDFGTVEEGIDVSCIFKVKNAGNKTLHIDSVRSSCGCTVPLLKAKFIEPGASTDLKVVMDTSMKQGFVDKEVEIRSDDPSNLLIKIQVKANVTDPHAGMGADSGAKIFKGRCAACHVLLGEGKLGEDLYMADCAMCHGFRAKGGVGPSLLSADYKNDDVVKRVQEVIEEGSKTHRSMPGFLKEKGGPLTKEQIDSLLAYLSWRAEMERGATK